MRRRVGGAAGQDRHPLFLTSMSPYSARALYIN
jgi:hypothetical protein